MTSLRYLIIILFTGLSFTQSKQDLIKPTVLIAGTMHTLPWPLTANYNYLSVVCAEFLPDNIMIEYVKPQDSISMRNFYDQELIRKSDSVAGFLSSKGIAIKAAIDSIIKLPSARYNISTYKLLSNLYFANRDYGNYYYQISKLIQYLGNLTGDEQKEHNLNYYKELYFNKHKRNEFGTVIFPLANMYSIPYLYPIDDHTYEKEYEYALQMTDREMQGTEYQKKAADKLSSSKWEALVPVLFGNLVKKVNSPEFQNLALELETELYPRGVSAWYDKAAGIFRKRNQLMALNIAEAINKSKGKRIVVFAGASHVPFLKYYLKRTGNFNVLTLPEFEMQEAKED